MKSKPIKTETESINNEFIKLYKFSIERYVVKKNTTRKPGFFSYRVWVGDGDKKKRESECRFGQPIFIFLPSAGSPMEKEHGENKQQQQQQHGGK